MKILFLDESGDHNLSTIDPSYPLFILGGVILDQKYAETTLVEEINTFKHSLFGHTDIILHTADITRNKNGFERLKEAAFRELFYSRLNSLIKRLNFSVVACVVHKEKHLAQYGLAALDPYFLSLDTLAEKFCMEIGGSPEEGAIIAKRRNLTLDRALDLAWLNLKIQGTRHIQASRIENHIKGLSLRSKTENLPGLQLADLVLTPIGRYVLGKAVKEDFRVIQEKFRRKADGSWEGHNLVIFPQQKSQPPLRSGQLMR